MCMSYTILYLNLVDKAIALAIRCTGRSSARAMGNQKEEQLVAFLADYPRELRQRVSEMRQALESGDFERLQEAAQQLMGSASFVCAIQLRDYLSELIEAIDLEVLEEVEPKMLMASREAEDLARELQVFTKKGQEKALID